MRNKFYTQGFGEMQANISALRKKDMKEARNTLFFFVNSSGN